MIENPKICDFDECGLSRVRHFLVLNRFGEHLVGFCHDHARDFLAMGDGSQGARSTSREISEDEAAVWEIHDQ